MGVHASWGRTSLSMTVSRSSKGVSGATVTPSLRIQALTICAALPALSAFTTALYLSVPSNWSGLGLGLGLGPGLGLGLGLGLGPGLGLGLGFRD